MLVVMMMCVPQVFALSQIRVRVNGTQVYFPDGQPYADANSRVLVPVRFVSEALGATVRWDGKVISQWGDAKPWSNGQCERSTFDMKSFNILGIGNTTLEAAIQKGVDLAYGGKKYEDVENAPYKWIIKGASGKQYQAQATCTGYGTSVSGSVSLPRGSWNGNLSGSLTVENTKDENTFLESDYSNDDAADTSFSVNEDSSSVTKYPVLYATIDRSTFDDDPAKRLYKYRVLYRNTS